MVYVQFTIGTDGRVTDEKVLRGIGGGCDEEALRVSRPCRTGRPGNSGQPRARSHGAAHQVHAEMNTWRVVAEGFKVLVFLGPLACTSSPLPGATMTSPTPFATCSGAALVAYAGFKVVRLVGLLRAGRDGRMRSGDR